MYRVPIMQVVNIPIHAVVENTGTVLITGPELKLSEPITERPPMTTRTSGYKPRVFDKQRLLILIKPTIIIPEEAPEEAIGQLASLPVSGMGGGMSSGMRVIVPDSEKEINEE